MKSTRVLVAALVLLTCSGRGPARANPVGEAVRAGNATFNRAAGSLTVHQTSQRVVIDWRDFSIRAGEITRFVQPNANAAALNRVTAGNPSMIYGTLQANGRVYLINPNGILVGPGGQIDTRHFVGSTLDVSTESFLRDAELTFKGSSPAAVRNFGRIEALGGDVFLIAHTVENAGTIRAPDGKVGLAAGVEVVLQPSGSEGIAVLAGRSDGSPTPNGVNNRGVIEAASAELKAAGGNVYALAINNEGVVRAHNVVREQNGQIWLRADGGNIANSGTLAARGANGGGNVTVDAGHNPEQPATVTHTGTIDVRGEAPGAVGGNVTVTGDRVGLFDQAAIDASGHAGGGTVRVGGGYQGNDSSVRNAQRTVVDRAAAIRADALAEGDGGTVIVWSDEMTRFSGSISAMGGPLGGNGGTIETSSRGWLELIGAVVSAGAFLGEGGDWLLDPVNVAIRDLANANGGFDNGNPRTFTPTADTAVADRNVIQAALDAGTSVTIRTHAGAGPGPGSQAGDITVVDAITKSGFLNATLTLEADRDVVIQAPVQMGNGSLTIAANGAISQTAGGTLSVGGQTTLSAGGGITLDAGNDFASVALSSGGTVTLRDVNDITFADSLIGGDFAVTAPGGIADSGSIQVNGLSTILDAGFGDIELDQGGRFGTLSLRGNNVTLREEDATVLGASQISGSLSVINTLGGITDAGTLTVGGNTVLSAAGSDITLGAAGSSFGTLYLNGANVSVTEQGATDLGVSTVTGNLNVTSTDHITQSGILDVGGASTFTVRGDGAGRDVLLGLANRLQGLVSVSVLDLGSIRDLEVRTTTSGASLAALPPAVRNLTLAFDQVDVQLPGITVSENLSVTAGGAIADNGPLIVTGDARFASTGLDQDIVLDSGLDVTGSLSLQTTGTGGDAAVLNARAIDFGASSVGGHLAATAQTGNITDRGEVSIGNGATFVTLGEEADISLDQLNLTGGSLGIVTTDSVADKTANATIVNTVGIDLAASTINGDLSLTATTGDITQSGAIAAEQLSLDASGSIVLGNLVDKSPGAQPQNQITALGDVRHGGDFYLYDSSQTTYQFLDAGNSLVNGHLGLTLRGEITDRNGDASSGSVIIRTLGDLQIDPLAGQIKVQGGGREVILSAESSDVQGIAGSFHNLRPFEPLMAATLAIQVSGGARYIIYSTDDQLNTPVLNPGLETVQFGGLSADWIWPLAPGQPPATFFNTPPGFSLGTGNGFVFAVNPNIRASDEGAKFFVDVLKLKPFRGFSFIANVKDLPPVEEPTIYRSSYHIYDEEQRAAEQKRNPVAQRPFEVRLALDNPR